MPGLLKQIQKQKTKSDASVGDVLFRPGLNERGVRTGEKITEAQPANEGAEAGGSDGPSEVLIELSDEATEKTRVLLGAHRVGTRILKIVRRRGAQKDNASRKRLKDSSPAWLTEEPKSSAALDALMKVAVAIVSERLARGESEQAVADLLSDFVKEAAAKIQPEYRVTRKLQVRAEEELRDLLSATGPLAPLYEDQMVTDIFIDGHQTIKVTRQGRTIATPLTFRTAAEYKLYLGGLFRRSHNASEIDLSIIDFVLTDRYLSRVNIVDSSLVEGDEPRVCIRIPRLQHVSFYDLLQNKALPASLAAWLTDTMALGETNILVVGPVGSGKTVMATALLNAVGTEERIIVVEDLPEISLPTPHLERLLLRPLDSAQRGGVPPSMVLLAALRRAPHRLAIGEVTQDIAAEFLRAFEIGHLGSLATLQAENARDGLWRLVDFICAREHAPQESVMRRIGRSIDMVLTMRKVDGMTCLVELAELAGIADNDFVFQPLISYLGRAENRRQWQIETQHSHWLDHFAEKGVALLPARNLFAPKADNPAPLVGENGDGTAPGSVV